MANNDKNHKQTIANITKLPEKHIL